MRKSGFLRRNARALSPIFATVMLAAIVITMGSIAFFFSSRLTNDATNQYVSQLSGSQQAVSERVMFENVVYNSSSLSLKIYLINCGIANNIQISSVTLYDAYKNMVGSPYSGAQLSVLQPVDEGTALPTSTPVTGNKLNVGWEGYFSVTLGAPLVTGSMYTICLNTISGSRFNFEFTP